MAIRAWLLVAACGIGLFWWLPQLVRVLRRGAAGVSADTWSVSTTNLLLWSLWGLTAGQEIAAAVNFIQALGSAAVVAMVGITRRTCGLAAAFGAVVAAAQFWPPAAGSAAVGGVLAVRVPQLLTLFKAPDPGSHQVSTTAWTMSAVSNALWFAWGVADHHPTMIVGAGVSVIASTAIIAAARGARAPSRDCRLPSRR